MIEKQIGNSAFVFKKYWNIKLKVHFNSFLNEIWFAEQLLSNLIVHLQCVGGQIINMTVVEFPGETDKKDLRESFNNF